MKPIGLEDDRRTKEVLRDLGLSYNGPYTNSVMYKAYLEWSLVNPRQDEDGLDRSDPSISLGFGPTRDLERNEVSTSFVQNTTNEIQGGKDERA